MVDGDARETRSTAGILPVLAAARKRGVADRALSPADLCSDTLCTGDALGVGLGHRDWRRRK